MSAHETTVEGGGSAVSRKQFLGLAMLGAVGAARPRLTRGPLIAMMSNNVDPEEEMYKELFFGMCSDTWPKDVTLPITEIRRQFCFISSTLENVTLPNVTDLRNLSGANPFYTCPNLDSCYLPAVTELRDSPLLAQNFKHIYFSQPLTFPELYPLNNKPTVHRTYHFSQTHDTVQSSPNFPFTNVESYKSIYTFSCTDGDLDYDTSTQTWVFTPKA